MKPLAKQYISSGMLLLAFLFVGICCAIPPQQETFHHGTQIGKFWLPDLSAGWRKSTFNEGIFEGVKYSTRFNNSTIAVSFTRSKPIDDIRLNMDDLKQIVNDTIGKKDIKLQSEEISFHGFQTLKSHKTYVTTPFQIKNVSGWNGSYGEDGISVEQRSLQILCEPDRYTLWVTLYGKNITSSQPFTEDIWNSLIRHMRFAPDAAQ